MWRWPGGALARWGASQVGAHLAEAELASPGPSHLRTAPNSAMWWLKGAIPTTSQISRHDPGRRRGALEFPAHLDHEAFTTGPVARFCRERPKYAAVIQSVALSPLQAESHRHREPAFV